MFKVVSQYEPSGDQPTAIESLADGVLCGHKAQTLLGVTGSGKTFTMAKIIEKVQKPTLILAHNKTLAGQLYDEFKAFFPDNAVEYFVSYYDYYQPEAYVPGQDLYIEKDSDINDDIDKMRHSATAALTERKDVIIIASVSCIYGLGSPKEYEELALSLRPEMVKDRDEVIRNLIDIQYERNEIDFHRGTFRVKGDTIEIFPATSHDYAVRVEFFGDEVERITEISALTGELRSVRKHVSIYPASHYVTTPENMKRALVGIAEELNTTLKTMREENRLVEAQRLMQRTNYDMEILREMGYCKGIENYTRHINNSKPGDAPFTLIDYFPEDFLMFIDESHATIPQVRGMSGGDHSRKKNLIDYGFRLPSAYDNRPLNFAEFESRLNQVIFVSATPADYEKEHSLNVAEQIVRPTGLLDPPIQIVAIKGQIEHLVMEIKETISDGSKVLVTTLTKRMAEDLTDYLAKLSISVAYLHSDIDTVERMRIIKDLRLGVYDVLVGINLLREGLDIPEVSLVAILDADKEGFLRSETSLIQTVGRAARNVNGHVIMYADKITPSMQKTIDETNRRREKQSRYNQDNNIIPKGIVRAVHEVITAELVAEEVSAYNAKKRGKGKSKKKEEPLLDTKELIKNLETEMKNAAKELDFERAAVLRDRINNLQKGISKN